MGVSTDGIICFGIRVVQEASLPWDDREKYDNGIYDWWVNTVLGYKPPFQLFDDGGNWINGIEAQEQKVNEYHNHRREFRKNNPQLPIDLVMHCSGNFPMWIIADKELGMSANRGFPKSFDPYEMSIATDRHMATIEDFVEKWKIETEGEIGWWLCSLWF